MHNLPRKRGKSLIWSSVFRNTGQLSILHTMSFAFLEVASSVDITEKEKRSFLWQLYTTHQSLCLQVLDLAQSIPSLALCHYSDPLGHNQSPATRIVCLCNVICICVFFLGQKMSATPSWIRMGKYSAKMSVAT